MRVHIEAAIMPCDCDGAETWNKTSVMNLPQLTHEMPSQTCFQTKPVPEHIQLRMQR